ncbi:MAG TPA: hypothetical protein VKA54_00485 [Gemmatimonadaceae bacterium]|nr:hypothetical protein [Gemmatimonadaceae bacterium]
MRSSRAVLIGVMTMLVVTACEIEKVGIPQPERRVALHGVLSASAFSQVVLLERTRNGSISVRGPSFELEDPLGSDSGIAENDAIVTLTTPSGATLVAREDNTVLFSTGGGVYRFSLPGSALERNGTYRLSVLTRSGERLGAETVVPSGAVAVVAESRTFDRSGDPLVVEWPPTPGARSYLVRVETPYGPRSFFTADTRVRLSGDLRNADLDALPHVFIPGFPQTVTVSAVDSNYYDWFRTHNDALSGTGVINRVSGGLGVFGSLVRLRLLDLTVVAPQQEPIAGRFRFVGTEAEATSTRYLSLELYVEATAARSDQSDALSGRAIKRLSLGETGCRECGVLGSAKGGQVELQFLRAWSGRDTAETFAGELRGDTLVGTYRFAGGIARFVREP